MIIVEAIGIICIVLLIVFGFAIIGAIFKAIAWVFGNIFELAFSTFGWFIIIFLIIIVLCL